MAVNSQKFLPSSTRGGSIVKSSSAIVSASKISSRENKGTFFEIKVKVIEIDKILKGTLALKKKQLDDKKKSENEKGRKKQEEKLERKPKDDKDKVKLPGLPRTGFLDGIKNFIGKILLGYFAHRLVEHLPKILPIINFIGSASDFIINVGGKLLNGLVSFIDWGYKAYDATRGFMKNMFGEDGAKQFDQLAGLLNQFLNLALIVGMAGSGRPFGGRGAGGKKITGIKGATSRYGTSAAAARKYAEKYGRDAAVRKFGEKGVRSLGGKYARSGVANLGRKASVSVLGKGGAKAALKVLKPILSKLPLIGGLIEFGISWALGDPIGKAAFRGIGAGLVGAVGTAIGGPIGMAIGGFVGGEVGGALYDMFFGNKKPQPIADEAQGSAGGGVTRGGKFQGQVKRQIKKAPAKRQIKITPKKLEPGSSIGGDKQIEKIFPKSEDSKTVNPMGYVGEFYDTTSNIPFFGPLFAIATKTLVGDKPTQLDYKNAGSGLNNWMNNTFNTEIMRAGFAGGGEVNAEMFIRGEDLTDAIAKSLEESLSKKVDDSINELLKQLQLKPLSKPAGVPGPTTPGAEDLINIQGGDADFWTLVAVASREDGEPQAWADVAQSIYNRLASGAYSGKTIKDLILGQMQYEPTWRYPNGSTRGTGRPNPEWYQIKDAASAGVAAGQSEDAMKKVAAALLDPTLQKNAREFIQGRTDFRGYSVSGGIQRKSGDNYFGWYNNYTANKIGSVPNFGATASTGSGPGMSGPLGTGSVGAVDQFNSIAKKYGLSITSSYRQGDSGYHGKNRARDYSNDSVGNGTPEQLKFAQHLVKNYGSSLTQLIYTPLGFGIANGKKVGLDYWGSSTNAQHYHHVHVALKDGGLVDGVTYAMLGERGREFVIDADSTAALEQKFPGFLDALNKANYDGAINVLRSYTDYERSSSEIVFVPVEVPNSDESYSTPGSDLTFSGGGEQSSPFSTLYEGG